MWRVRITAARVVLLCAECVRGLHTRVYTHFDTQSRGQARTCMEQRMTLLTALGARVVRAKHGGAFLLLCRDYAHGACVRAYIHLHPQLRGQARMCMEQRTTLCRALGVHVCVHNMPARFLLLRPKYAHGAYARTRHCAHAPLRGQTRVSMDVRATLLGSHDVHGEREKQRAAFFF